MANPAVVPEQAAPAAPAAAPAAAMAFNFKAVLQQLIQRNASDLHL